MDAIDTRHAPGTVSRRCASVSRGYTSVSRSYASVSRGYASVSRGYTSVSRRSPSPDDIMRAYDGSVAALTLCCCAAVLSLSSRPTDASDFHDDRPSRATAAVGRRRYDETTAVHRGPALASGRHDDDDDDDNDDDEAGRFDYADGTGDRNDRADEDRTSNGDRWWDGQAPTHSPRPSRAKSAVGRRRHDEMTAVRRGPPALEEDGDGDDEADEFASRHDFADDGTGDDDVRAGDDDVPAAEDRTGDDVAAHYVDDKAKRGAVLDGINDYYRGRYGEKSSGRPAAPAPYPVRAYAGNGLRVDTSMLRGETVELPTYVNVPVTLRCKFVPVDGSENKFETVVEAMRPGHGAANERNDVGDDLDDGGSHASRALDQLVGSVDGWREVVKSARPVRRAVVDRFARLADRVRPDRPPVRAQHRRRYESWPRSDDAYPAGSPRSDDAYSAASPRSDDAYSAPSRRPVERWRAAAAAPASIHRRHHRDGGLLQTEVLKCAAERVKKFREARQWVMAAKSRPAAATADDDRSIEGWRRPQLELPVNQLVDGQVDDPQSDVADDRPAEDLDGQQQQAYGQQVDDNQQQAHGQQDDGQRVVDNQQQAFGQQDVDQQQAYGQQIDDRQQQAHGQQDDGQQQAYGQQVDDNQQQAYGQQDVDQQQAYGQQIDGQPQIYGQHDDQQAYGQQDDQQAYDGQQVDDRHQQAYGQQDNQQAYGQQADRLPSYGPFGAEDPSVGQGEAGVTVELATEEVDDPSKREVGHEGGSHEITAVVAGPYPTVFGESEQQSVSPYEDHAVPTDSA